MKIVIAGSRTITNYQELLKAIEYSIFKDKITEVVSGTAAGADTLGEYWASNYNIPVHKMPAKWDVYGKAAGHIRNKEMAKYGDGAIILWDGASPGAKSMIKYIKQENKPFFINVVNV